MLGWQGEAMMSKLLWWIAGISGMALALLLVAMVTGDDAGEPNGVAEWVYLAFFPVGCSVGLLLGWWRPLVGGTISIASMVLSQATMVATGRVFPLSAYTIWGVMCVPGALFVIVGLRRRFQARP